MEIFHISRKFPSEEKYSLTNQIRRSSRSVCTNLVEHIEGEDTGNILSINSMIRKRKMQKHRFGWIFLMIVTILQRMSTLLSH